ncbi:MAG: hypothetical protein ABFS05_00680 [Bacteroidota bacterium]
MRFFLIIVFISLIGISRFHTAMGQQKNPVRVELNANLEMENYHLVPCEENGLLVFFESPDQGTDPDTRIWHFAFYDKNMKQAWIADTALPEGAKFKAYDHDGEHTYLNFLNTDRVRSSSNTHILKVNYKINTFELLHLSIPDKSQAAHFEIIKGQAILAINNTAFEPGIVFINLSDGATRNIKFELEGLNIIQEVQYDEAGNSFHIVLDNYLGKKQNALLIIEISPQGNITKTLRINPVVDQKVLNEARIAYSGNDTMLVIGTYHHEISRLQSSKEEEGAESAGYFIAKFVQDKQVLMNYYNFLEFEEMYRSLSSKTIADIRRKAEKQKNRGQEYSLDYTLKLHDIVDNNGNYVLLSEAYYPEYRTVTNMYYDYYGRPIPQTYTVFDGYKYISGIAASFSPDGNLLWDNGIEIRNVLTFNITNYVGSFSSNDELALFYSNENKIHYKIVGDAYSGGASQSIRLERKYKGDKLMEDMGSKMIHWYDNYFICYGYQKIKNNRISGGKRTIFYFNKLAFK